jgi:hypothetical protein
VCTVGEQLHLKRAHDFQCIAVEIAIILAIVWA